MTASERLIVALDMPVDDAVAAIDRLDTVRAFKVGWQLFLSAAITDSWRSLRGALADRTLFLDLKLPADIDTTVAMAVRVFNGDNVHFMSLSAGMSADAIRAAKNVGSRVKLLSVPRLSSMWGVDSDIAADAVQAVAAGCDGVVASGTAIAACRQALNANAIIVSPGIRRTGEPRDDHARHTTPTEALRWGADYLVVGRPITQARDPLAAANDIIREIQNQCH